MTAPVTERPRGPIDPRLWTFSRSARGYLVLTVVLSLVTALAVICSAVLIGRILAGVIVDPAARTIGHWTGELCLLAVAVAVRVLGTWLQSRFAHRSASRVVGELEVDVLSAATRFDPRTLDAERDATAVVVTRAIGGLRAYLSGYLPALILAVTLTPIALVVIFVQDVTSALIIIGTLPLIPIFMILIGLLTRNRAQATLKTMTALSAQLLDLLAGLPTLRALGRERGPAARIRALGDAHRRTTMRALKIAFLSSMVLELLATLCVALVAVGIGLRLVFGEMSIEAGIIVLILAPEVYLPLRAVGTQFHAAEDGMEAAGKAFGILERTNTIDSGSSVVDARGSDIVFADVGVPARGTLAPCGLSLTAKPARITVLTGANGVGKSTALHAVLGLATPTHGHVAVSGVAVTELDQQSWWDQIVWLPQRPVVLPGTLYENVSMHGVPSEQVLKRACAATGFDSVVADRGWGARVGTGGVGLSLGELQRLALTRTLVSDAPVVLLDEPTAHLDAASEAAVLHSIRMLADEGRTVIVVGHRTAVLNAADTIVEVHHAEI